MNRKTMEQDVRQAYRNASDRATAAASGYQIGAVAMAQAILAECKDSLSSDTVREIKALLRAFDEAYPYGVTVLEDVADPL